MIFSFSKPNSPDYQEGVDAGFEMAEDYMKEAVKEFYKSIKHKQLLRMATTTTVTTHKCNCEYCDLDTKELKKF